MKVRVHILSFKIELLTLYIESNMILESLRADDEYSEYKLDYILAESFKSYYATIDGLTIEPVWIPKICVNKNYRVKNWWVNQFKAGKPTWKKIEIKVVQKKLKHFIKKVFFRHTGL